MSYSTLGEAVSTDQSDRVGTAVMAGLLGALVATSVGRPLTRFDNFIIGGLFTGFAAYRDPRASAMGTFLVAIGEGALWGGTDRLAPHIKDMIMPPPPMEKALSYAY